MSAYRDIAWNGIWKQNTGLVQLLGLCPLLAVSTKLVNAVSLGSPPYSSWPWPAAPWRRCARFIPYEIRIPVFILIIAALVTVVDLAFNAWLHELYLVLGIFIPLIVTNCIVLARVEAFAAKNDPLAARRWDGIMMGIGLVWVLACWAAHARTDRQRHLFSGIEMIIPGARRCSVLRRRLPRLPDRHPAARRLHRARLLIAGRNWLDARAAAARATASAAPAEAASA
jgi:electron transport complex protein RnfE